MANVVSDAFLDLGSILAPKKCWYDRHGLRAPYTDRGDSA